MEKKSTADSLEKNRFQVMEKTVTTRPQSIEQSGVNSVMSDEGRRPGEREQMISSFVFPIIMRSA